MEASFRPPLLSILIPAYNYRSGLERILCSLVGVSADIEVLVFDDSYDCDLRSCVDSFADKITALTYRHNPTHFGAALGAAGNWNALLDAASGDYVILMHHDEMPYSKNFFENLCKILAGPGPADIYLLDLILLDERLRVLRRHVPRSFRRIVLQRWPGYLFWRNVIGPTGTLAIRRSIAPRFDKRLRWLIDVEFYMELFSQSTCWVELPQICVGSVQRSSGTITATLADRLDAVNALERELLSVRYPKLRTWFVGTRYAPLRFAEKVAWAIFRVAMFLAEQFKRGQV